jgi:putative hydrolase of the HAD superfamily
MGPRYCGLQAHYNIDAEDYLAFVHDLPLEEYISLIRAAQTCSLASRGAGSSTNSDHNHANRVINILRLAGCFDGIIDILGRLCLQAR